MSFSFDVDANNIPLQDDDLILAFDEDPSGGTVHEEVDEYEEYTITYDAPENPAEDNEGSYELDAAETGDDHDSKHPEDGERVATAAETASIHTSTTINGDEIDYDEEDALDDSLTPADDGAHHQSVAASGVDDDEIGWDNDEDENENEYEEQPTGGDDAADLENPTEAALSPPSVARKRGRTDDTEGLADELGMPPRPPHKRIRMC
jgi:hypothetical protein